MESESLLKRAHGQNEEPSYYSTDEEDLNAHNPNSADSAGRNARGIGTAIHSNQNNNYSNRPRSTNNNSTNTNSTNNNNNNDNNNVGFTGNDSYSSYRGGPTSHNHSAITGSGGMSYNNSTSTGGLSSRRETSNNHSGNNSGSNNNSSSSSSSSSNGNKNSGNNDDDEDEYYETDEEEDTRAFAHRGVENSVSYTQKGSNNSNYSSSSAHPPASVPVSRRPEHPNSGGISDTVNGMRANNVVYINLYDLPYLGAANAITRVFGVAAYHSGVQIYDKEYGYGGHDEDCTGIYEVDPQCAEGYRFSQKIPMGTTVLSPSQVHDLVLTMQTLFMGNEYDVIHRNCNHFSNELVMHLVGKPIPDFVNRLARAGSVISGPVSRLPSRWKRLSRSSNSRSSASSRAPPEDPRANDESHRRFQ